MAVLMHSLILRRVAQLQLGLLTDQDMVLWIWLLNLKKRFQLELKYDNGMVVLPGGFIGAASSGLAGLSLSSIGFLILSFLLQINEMSILIRKNESVLPKFGIKVGIIPKRY